MLLATVFISCESNSSSESSKESDSDEFCEYDYVTDSIGDEAVSHDCAIIFTKLQELQWRWEEARSPNTIARLRATWKKDIADAEHQAGNFGGEESRLLDSVISVIRELHNKQCSEYLVPASGIIMNLSNCIERVDKANTKRDLERFREPRLGMLNELDNIHLCIEESSNEIGKVKRLAETLKSKYEEKCRKLGVQ